MLTARLLRRALVALLLAVPLLATGGTAHAAACSGTSGVSVVVQFPDGHTEIGCAPGDPASGKAALDAAGFPAEYTAGQPFVCKIKQLPGDASCHGTPPGNAYWAYFHAQRGGSWAYNSQGAASSNPAPGSVEGWRFGSGAKPSTPPPGRAAAKPKPKPAPTPKPAPSHPPASSAAPSGPATHAASTSAPASAGPVAKSGAAKPVKQAAKAKRAGTATKAPAKKVATDASASASASPTGEPSETTVSAPVQQTGAASAEGGGTSWLWGVAALVLVGGAAGAVTVVRRR